MLKLDNLWELIIRRCVQWDVVTSFPVVETRKVRDLTRKLLGTLVAGTLIELSSLLRTCLVCLRLMVTGVTVPLHFLTMLRLPSR